jgi:hypothetical protein
MIKCIICEKEFKRRSSRNICCSIECSRKRNSETNMNTYFRNKSKLHSIKDEFNIPIETIKKYGEKMLRENVEFLETLQVINRLTGCKYISEEDRKVRKDVSINTYSQNKRMINVVDKECKVCEKKYTKLDVNIKQLKVTCSKECSKELKRIKGINWYLKQKSKKLEI